MGEHDAFVCTVIRGSRIYQTMPHTKGLPCTRISGENLECSAYLPGFVPGVLVLVPAIAQSRAGGSLPFLTRTSTK